MKQKFLSRLLKFLSDNRKSKTRDEPSQTIENLKWLGLSVIAFALVVAGAAVQAQQPNKVPRIGYLTGAYLSAITNRIEAFRQGLRELGYVEGKNIVIEWRSAESRTRAILGARGRAGPTESGRYRDRRYGRGPGSSRKPPARFPS